MKVLRFLSRVLIVLVVGGSISWTSSASAGDTYLFQHQNAYKSCVRLLDWTYTVDSIDFVWEMHRDECGYYEKVTVTMTLMTGEPLGISEPMPDVTTVTVCPAGPMPETCVANVGMDHPDVEVRNYDYFIDARGSDGRFLSQGVGGLPTCRSVKVIANCGGDWVIRTPD